LITGRRESRMPQIIVTAGPTDQQGQAAVTLRERVSPADFESERFAANLVERLGWAVVDATEEEQEVGPERPVEVSEPEPASEPMPTPEPVATA
jgi:hypothetical protein